MIRGLGDKDLDFPEIGKIRKGKKVKENMPDGTVRTSGVDLDYFRVIFNKGEAESEGVFFNKYGQQPAELNVMLPLLMENTWDAWLEAYSRGRMVAKSDGVHYKYLRDQKMNVIVRDWELLIDHPDFGNIGDRVPYEGKRGHESVWPCQPGGTIRLKQVGRLKVTIMELERRACLELKTHSYDDIENLGNQIRSIYFMEEYMGAIPLVLKRMPKKKTLPVNGRGGNAMRKEMYMLSIEPAQSWVRWKMLADQKRVMEEWGLGSGKSSSGVLLGGDVIEGDFTDGDGTVEDEDDSGNRQVPDIEGSPVA